MYNVQYHIIHLNFRIISILRSRRIELMSHGNNFVNFCPSMRQPHIAYTLDFSALYTDTTNFLPVSLWLTSQQLFPTNSDVHVSTNIRWWFGWRTSFKVLLSTIERSQNGRLITIIVKQGAPQIRVWSSWAYLFRWQIKLILTAQVD